eukprot:364964-Chlamydomonas_euryale.AAC.7
MGRSRASFRVTGSVQGGHRFGSGRSQVRFRAVIGLVQGGHRMAPSGDRRPFVYRPVTPASRVPVLVLAFSSCAPPNNLHIRVELRPRGTARTIMSGWAPRNNFQRRCKLRLHVPAHATMPGRGPLTSAILLPSLALCGRGGRGWAKQTQAHMKLWIAQEQDIQPWRRQTSSREALDGTFACAFQVAGMESDTSVGSSATEGIFSDVANAGSHEALDGARGQRRVVDGPWVARHQVHVGHAVALLQHLDDPGVCLGDGLRLKAVVGGGKRLRGVGGSSAPGGGRDS